MAKKTRAKVSQNMIIGVIVVVAIVAIAAYMVYKPYVAPKGPGAPGVTTPTQPGQPTGVNETTPTVTAIARSTATYQGVSYTITVNSDGSVNFQPATPSTTLQQCVQNVVKQYVATKDCNGIRTSQLVCGFVVQNQTCPL